MLLHELLNFFSDSNLVTESTALMVLTYPYFPMALCFYVPKHDRIQTE